MLTRLHSRLGALPLAAAFAAVLAPAAALADDITVFAAASLKNALGDIAPKFEEATGHHLVISLAGSSALARQIEQGAPADVFISANPGWMDHLEEAGLVAEGTRRDLLRNSIVLIAHDAPATPVTLSADLDLDSLLGEDGKLAMALVEAVPAGIYGKAALEHLGLWGAAAPRVAQADNVRAALALVALGEAPYGIVYATDAHAEPKVSVVAEFPADSHPPIVYPAAILAGHESEAASALLSYLDGPAARLEFERQGFTVVPQPADPSGS
ncbi:MAG: molybdate ABC transporter substrate-binding protein [Paracoccaceae bacterium]